MRLDALMHIHIYTHALTGAMISTHLPQLLKLAKTSFMSLAATVTLKLYKQNNSEINMMLLMVNFHN